MNENPEKTHLADMLESWGLESTIPNLVSLLNNKVNAIVATADLLAEDVSYLSEDDRDLVQLIGVNGRDVLAILQAVAEYDSIQRKKKQE